MKVTKIRLAGIANIDLALSGVDPDDRFVLKGADGLGPVEVDVLSSGERRPHVREMVFLIGLQPLWGNTLTAQGLRRELYTLLTPEIGATVKVQLMNGNTVEAYAECQVKKMEVALFSKDPEVQITVSCIGATASYFLSPTTDTTDMYFTVDGSDTYFQTNNSGTAPCGFRVDLILGQNVAPSSSLILEDISSEDLGITQSVILKGEAFTTGDRVIIDTRKRQRGVWVIPVGTTAKFSILDKLDEDSVWPQMNVFGGFKVNAILDQVIMYETPAYWGI